MPTAAAAPPARIFAARPAWVEPPPADPAEVNRLASSLRLPLPLCRILAQRGHGDPDSARRFLRPRPDHLHPHWLLAGMAEAAERVAAAVRRGEAILVHGDYDVDGVCSTALLTRCLRMMGARVVPFAPHRLEHGYDLGSAGIEAAARAGAGLIVTADCGIVAHGAVRAAAERGIDVVVTDHHTPGPTLPEAVAVVNPNQPDCAYPNKGLVGAAVAYKLLSAVAERIGFSEERLSPFLEMVAIATIADLAPLTAENRAIVRWGLSILARTPNPGLRALLRSARLADRSEITAGQVGFVLAPRLNAVGRVGNPMAAVRLLLTDDLNEAERLANLHELENRRRRELDEETLADALSQLDRWYDPDVHRGVVLASDRWHPGVIGIVASRVVERIHRPTVLIALAGGEARGSGRSVRGFHLQQALAACSEHLDRFGGHRAAAGCSLRPERVDAFRDAFDDYARRALPAESLVPELRIDAALELAEATPELIAMLRHFAPFGPGNPTPLFVGYGIAIDSPRVVGGRHLRAVLRTDDARIEAIGFGLGDRLAEVAATQRRFEVAFKLEENEWTGRDGRTRKSVQARVVDLRPAA